MTSGSGTLCTVRLRLPKPYAFSSRPPAVLEVEGAAQTNYRYFSEGERPSAHGRAVDHEPHRFLILEHASTVMASQIQSRR